MYILSTSHTKDSVKVLKKGAYILTLRECFKKNHNLILEERKFMAQFAQGPAQAECVLHSYVPFQNQQKAFWYMKDYNNVSQLVAVQNQ